jgi:DNA-binding CsgD family transcriptional regulator
MKQQPFNIEFYRIFESYTNESTPGRLKFDREKYNKFLNFFLLGKSFYLILNHHTQDFDFVSKSLEETLGYDPAEFNMAFLNNIIHPEDRSWYLAFGAHIIDFYSKLPVEKIMKYKVRFDFRLRQKDGSYLRMLNQGISIEHDPNGRFIRTLILYTDINYLKQEGKPVLGLIGMDGEPSYLDAASKNIFIESREDLTRRERQVLTLLIEGKLSKEISRILKISKQTVDTHRKNMLHKKNLSNTGELVGKAIRYGWV